MMTCGWHLRTVCLNLLEIDDIEGLVGRLHQLMPAKSSNEVAPKLAVGTDEKNLQRSAPWLLRWPPMTVG